MRGLFRFLLPLGLGALLLAGCCANNVCDCRDELADAFYFRFDTSGGPGSFAPLTELDTVLLKRFALPLDAKGQPLAGRGTTAHIDTLNAKGSFDLVTIVRATAVRPDVIVLNNNFPFAQSGSRKLSTYLYRIEVRGAPLGPKQFLKTMPRKYELNQIALKGEFYGSGCCTCYRNTLKSATLTDLSTGKVQLPAMANAQPGPVYTLITK